MNASTLRRRIGLSLLLGVSILLTFPQKGSTAAASTPLLTSYTGTPSPPYSTDWIDVSANRDLGVQVFDRSGSNGIGEVSVEGRVSTRAGPYLLGTCENPPDVGARTDRCYYYAPRLNFIRITVDAYTSGTFQAELETHPAN